LRGLFPRDDAAAWKDFGSDEDFTENAEVIWRFAFLFFRTGRMNSKSLVELIIPVF